MTASGDSCEDSKGPNHGKCGKLICSRDNLCVDTISKENSSITTCAKEDGTPNHHKCGHAICIVKDGVSTCSWEAAYEEGEPCRVADIDKPCLTAMPSGTATGVPTISPTTTTTPPAES